MNPYFQRSLEILFPAICGICSCDIGVYSQKNICRNCESEIKWDFGFHARLKPLNYVVSGGEFKDKLRGVIHLFKYRQKEDLGIKICREISNPKYLSVKDIDCLVPVPISKVRLLTRGFNQAEVLARYLGKMWNKPVLSNVLKRRVFSRSQVNLNRHQRKQNASRCYVLGKNKKVIKRLNILIIDDVITTGATIQKCGHLLRRAGAGSIWGLTLAREILKK